MIPFDLVEPKSLAEAIKLLKSGDGTVRPLGGGTALVPMIKGGAFRPRQLVSLRQVEPKYSEIALSGQDLRIGAISTLSSVERSAEVRNHAPLIARTMLTLANVRVRNVATVGGALAHGDPHMDLPPVLIALGARITISGPTGERSLALEDLFIGYYETVLENDELISEVRLPAQGRKRAAYMKVTTGSADDWPALCVAAALEFDGKRVQSARVVASAATVKATRLRATETMLAGATIDNELLARVGNAAAAEAEILPDVRGSVPYKRELLRVYVRRVLRQAIDENGVP
jgi:carbon-monoxide dehydrogenase medium subunit